ncbi:hypothetical protein KIL84_009986 [Mauremys mutica]|uniref:Nucleoside phosphorylase domain-containing protein n=1 Tax=Mauremys mutica TaxID=74926 RepID=A0A9D4AZD8_9SAUR|nr:hypothetical protein KIL84_009986 [Mauremys mutica]
MQERYSEGRKEQAWFSSTSCLINKMTIRDLLSWPVVGWLATFPIRVLKLLGMEILIVANAAGALAESFSTGELMIILDHINLPDFSGQNPLLGPSDERFGPHFPAFSSPCGKESRALAQEISESLGYSSFVREGVYCLRPLRGTRCNSDRVGETGALCRLGIARGRCRAVAPPHVRPARPARRAQRRGAGLGSHAPSPAGYRTPPPSRPHGDPPLRAAPAATRRRSPGEEPAGSGRPGREQARRGRGWETREPPPEMAAKVLNTLAQNVTNKYGTIDYSKWQRVEAKKKKPALPPIASPSEDKKSEGRSAGCQKDKRSVLFSPSSSLPSKTASSLNPRFAQQKTSAKETDVTKSLENIKIIKKLTKSKRKSLNELKHHSTTLVETNRRLAQDIQQTDASTAKHARDLLQQYEMFGTVISTLRDSNQNQVGIARAELQETEKMVEKNLRKLEHEVDHMNTKVQMLQEELNVLRTYMDKEYPVKAVQIAFMRRSIQNLKEEQQDEMEDIEDLAKTVMQQLEKKVQDEKEQILQAVAKDKAFLYQEGLKQMAVNNRILRNEIQMQKKVIHTLLEEITELRKSIVTLRWSVRDPREVIFADVLLRRPK